MKITRQGKWRRFLAVGVITVAMALGSVVGVAAAKAPTATRSNGPAGGDGVAAAHRALARLVADGTIEPGQADAIGLQVDAGSIDSKQLVDKGVVTDAQMQVVADAITAIKLAGG